MLWKKKKELKWYLIENIRPEDDASKGNDYWFTRNKLELGK